MDKLRMQSTNGVQENIEKIQSFFPDCVTETIDERTGELVRKVDFEKLQQNLSDVIISGREERYQFTWPDKKKAILLANSPVNAALRPCREESVDFDNTQNLYIEGDNLDVLKCLKETYLHKVKMIYIDPPYNTGNDFVYEDDFAESSAEYLANSGQFDEQGNRLVTNTESNGRFHTDWLNMIYPRLKVARDLLTDDGVIFISIDDNEIENLRKVCDEIFGESNFVTYLTIVNNPKGRNDSKHFANCGEYALVYCKNNYETKGLPLTDEQKAAFDKIDSEGNRYQLRDLRKRGNADSREDRPNMYFPVYYNQETGRISLDADNDSIAIYPIKGDGSDGRWRWGKDRVMQNLSILCPKKVKGGEKWGIEYKVYLNPSLNPADDSDEDEKRSKPKTVWADSDISSDIARRTLKKLFEKNIFDFPKSIELIKRFCQIGTKEDSIILDFFSGSATTAHAVMQLNAEDGGNRKFIMVQLPELTDEKSEAYKAGYKTICEIGKERIRRAGKKIKADSPLTTQDLDTGFRVLKLDSSNMEDIYYTPKDINQANLFSLVDNVKSDRTAEDLLFQVMLELGATLDCKIATKVVADKTIYNVADGYLVACFDKDVTDEVVTTIAKMHPLYAVLRDTSMANDSTATNFEQIFKSYSPQTTTKVL